MHKEHFLLDRGNLTDLVNTFVRQTLSPSIKYLSEYRSKNEKVFVEEHGPVLHLSKFYCKHDQK